MSETCQRRTAQLAALGDIGTVSILSLSALCGGLCLSNWSDAMPRETFHAGNTGPVGFPVPPHSPLQHDAAASTPAGDAQARADGKDKLHVSDAQTEPRAGEMFAHIAEALTAQISTSYESIENESYDGNHLRELRRDLRRLDALWWAFAPLMGAHRSRDDRASFRMLSHAIGSSRSWDLGSADLIPLFSDNGQSLNCFVTIESIRMRIAHQTLQACKDVQFRDTLRRIVEKAVEEVRSGDSPAFSDFASERLDEAEARLARVAAAAVATRRVRDDDVRRVRHAARRIGDLNDCFDATVTP